MIDLEYWAKIAPLGTALIALLALGVALRSINTQKAVARKRAAIDVFLKTDMDGELRDAYDKYRAAIPFMRKAASPEEFSIKNKTEYQAIRTYLDMNELISCGINNKVFDERVCYGFWYTVLTDICRDADEIIVHARQQPHGERTYDQLLKVNARWSGTHYIWQGWRR